MKRATKTYILVSTTENERVAGSLTVKILGPSTVVLNTETNSVTNAPSKSLNTSLLCYFHPYFM